MTLSLLKASSDVSELCSKLKETEAPHSPDPLEILSNEIVIMFGKLKKRGKINTAWKRRWFELSFLSNGLTLSYYQSKQNKKLCGRIEVANIYQIQAIDYNADEFKDDYTIPQHITLRESTQSESDYPNYTFILCTLGRDYVLSAPNSTDFIAWIELLNKYIFAKSVFDGHLDILQKNEWKKRYFVLDENKQLKYYKHKNKKEFVGSIPLSKINKIKNDKVCTACATSRTL